MTKKFCNALQAYSRRAAIADSDECEDELLKQYYADMTEVGNFAFVLGAIVSCIMTLLVVYKMWTVIAIMASVLVIKYACDRYIKRNQP